MTVDINELRELAHYLEYEYVPDDVHVIHAAADEIDLLRTELVQAQRDRDTAYAVVSRMDKILRSFDENRKMAKSLREEK